MSGFDDREKAYEAKYHLDEEIEFKVNVRRAKLLGLWAAEKLGLAGEDALAYSRQVVEADIAVPGHTGLLSKVSRDLAVQKISVGPAHLQHEMDRLGAIAKEQILAEVLAGRQTVPPE